MILLFPFSILFLTLSKTKIIILTPSQTIPGFYMSAVQVLKTLWEKEKLRAISPFLTVFSTLSGNFLPFSSNSKLLSANSLTLEGSKICCLGKGLVL